MPSNSLNTNRAIQITKGNEKIFAFIFATVLMFLAQKHINAQGFYADAANYWNLSSSIWHFSFPQSIRGYFYPLLLSPASFISQTFPQTGYLALYALQAVAFSFTLTVLLPDVFTRLIGGESSFARRLVPALLTAFFFSGLIAYPLTDLPAFCLLISSIALILSASNKEKITHSIFLMFLAGIAGYGAYNTRTIYLFANILLIIVAPLLAFKNTTTVRRSLLTIMFILGATVAAIPQALINLKYVHFPTPLVETSSLYAKQLKWGIIIQRYETGYDTALGRVFPVYYLNPEGERLLKKHGFGMSNATIAWYFETLRSAPLSFLRIYTKHFINGMDVRDDEVYTKVRSKEKNFRSIASISISLFGLFCLAALIVGNAQQGVNIVRYRKSVERTLWVIVIISPVIVVIPGAIETRFFLPLHLMAYCAIAFGFSGKRKEIITKNKRFFLVLYLVIASVFYMGASQSVSSPTNKIPAEYKLSF